MVKNLSIKVSVIIPVYNAEQYLDKSLTSVLNQTLDEIEIITVDDFSQDKSLEILRHYAKSDKRIKLIELKENKGQGYARNLAIKQASGEYIMCLDPDDWYEENACEILYNHAKKYDNDVVFFNYYIYSEKENKRFIDKTWAKTLKEKENGYSMNIMKDDLPYSFLHVARIHKRKFLIDNDCRYTETRCGEDNIFNISTTVFAKSISFLNMPLYTYRIIDSKNKVRKSVLKKRAQKFFEVISNLHNSYEFIKANVNGSYKNTYLIFHINHEIRYCLYYTKKSKKNAQEIYDLTRRDLQIVVSENDIEKIKQNIKYVELQRILKCDKYWKYCLKYKILSPFFN